MKRFKIRENKYLCFLSVQGKISNEFLMLKYRYFWWTHNFLFVSFLTKFLHLIFQTFSTLLQTSFVILRLVWRSNSITLFSLLRVMILQRCPCIARLQKGPRLYLRGYCSDGSEIEMQMFPQNPLPAPHRTTTSLQIITCNLPAFIWLLLYMTFTVIGDLPTMLIYLPQITSGKGKLPACRKRGNEILHLLSETEKIKIWPLQSF